MLRRPLAAATILLLASPIAPAAQPGQATAPAGAQVRGVLLDNQGLPAAGYQLGLQSPDGDLFISAPTGPDGAFAIEAIPTGTYRLVALAPDGSEFPVLSKNLTLKQGQVERLELKLGRASRMPGSTLVGESSTGEGMSFWKTTTGKIAVVVGGTAALGLALFTDGDDDDDEGKPPVSPSAPR